MSDLFMHMHQRRLSSAGVTRPSSPSAYDAIEDDPFGNILRLQLKKPKHWKWELSTSRSCTNIALPRIMLYDHRGELLADANTQEEKVYKQPTKPDSPLTTPSSPSTPSHATKCYAAGERKRSGRSATTNLTHSIRRALAREFNGLQIDNDEDENVSRASRSRTLAGSPLSADSCNAIDFYTNELPNESRSKSRSNSHSLKVRFKEDAPADRMDEGIMSLPLTPPSTSTTTTINTTPGTSSSSGPREKRRYRRSHSTGGTPTGSPSILERFSFSKGRLSSPEYMEEHQVRHGPRYYLRTSKAGTLVVQEDSFSRAGHCRRRRRMKNSSTENVSHDKSQSANSLSCGSPTKLVVPLTESRDKSTSLQNVVAEEPDTMRRRKLQPVRRYRSDGNVLLHKQISTSDEEPVMTAPKRREIFRGRQKRENGVPVEPQEINEFEKYHQQPWRSRFEAA